MKPKTRIQIKVYIAGKLNDLAVKYISNMHLMIKEACKVKALGVSVFVPCLDVLIGIVHGDCMYDDYADNNMSWLEVADIVYVLDNWATSNGTKKEIARAEELGIPVIFTIEQLTTLIEEIEYAQTS